MVGEQYERGPELHDSSYNDAQRAPEGRAPGGAFSLSEGDAKHLLFEVCSLLGLTEQAAIDAVAAYYVRSFFYAQEGVYGEGHC